MGLRRRGADPRVAVLWAWCPTVAIEAGSNAHIDVAGAALTVAALLVLARRPGAASSAKAPVAAGSMGGMGSDPRRPWRRTARPRHRRKTHAGPGPPAVLRRRPLTVLGAVAGAVLIVYLPHVVAVGGSVLGYLPGYLQEEGYGTGSRFALLSWLVPLPWTSAVAVVILALVGAASAWRATPQAPWHSAALTAGSAIVLTTPSYPWYAVLLVALVGVGARPEWLAVAAAGYVAQYSGELGLATSTAQRLAYGVALALVLSGWLRRRQDLPRLR